MVVLVSPLEQALEALRGEDEAASRNDGIVAGASSQAAARHPSQNIVSSLKRIKHALIGNASRKIELASRPEDLQR